MSTSFPSFDGFREAEEHQYSDILFDGLVLECSEIVAQCISVSLQHCSRPDQGRDELYYQ